jgi:CDP-6-deoxy-D-xylo-4-hexulose-3-dehydrase
MYNIPLVECSFFKPKKTLKLVIDFLKKNQKLSMSENCSSFESNFTIYQNTKYSVFFSSGSAANLALIQSLKNLGILKKNDNIAISSVTWSTNVMPIIQLDMNPIPIDVVVENLNIDLNEFKELHKKYSFKAIFVTNALSFSCNLKELSDFCNKNSILLLEDNCESLGSEYDGQKTGNFGLAGTFSFFVGHQMSTIEGGMVVTKNEELYEMLKIVRAHGWSRDNKSFKDSEFYSRFTFYDLGYNLRPQEINGVIGNFQLSILKENLNKRFMNFNKINKLLSNKKTLFGKNLTNNYYSPFAFPLIFKDHEYSLEIKNIFNEKKIEIRPIVSGNISIQPFFKKYISQKFELKNANKIHKNGFYFGINPEFSQKSFKFLEEVFDNIK